MIESLFEIYGQKAVDLIKSRVPVVSGKTRDSVNYEVTRDETSIKLVVKGRGYFKSVETGRGPTQGSSYQGFDKRLEEWLDAKGFQTKVSKKGIKYYKVGDGEGKWLTAKGLSIIINKQGDKKHNNGPVDVYSSELDRLVEELKRDLVKVIKEDLISIIK